MKNVLLLLILFITSNLLMAQIPNSSFENWDTINQTCNSWQSLNDLFGASNTTREPSSTAGMYSVGLTSINIPGFGIAPGLATTGNLNTTTFNIEGGYASNERPDSLIGFVKQQVLSGDTANISIVIKNTSGSTITETGGGSVNFTGTTTGFERFSIPISYSSSLPTDTILIIMTAGTLSSSVYGSKILVDQLYYTFPLSSPSINKMPISVSHAQHQLQIENMPQQALVSLIDLNGKEYRINQFPYNTEHLPNAIYILRITHPDYSPYIQKMVF